MATETTTTTPPPLAVTADEARALRAYSVWTRGYEAHPTTINAYSAAKAKYDHWRDVSDLGIKYTDMRVRLIGDVHDSEGFRRNAKYRRIEFAHRGMRVIVGNRPGVIVGHNESANLDVLFDEGWRGNCHPWSEITYLGDDGKILRQYDIRGAIVIDNIGAKGDGPAQNEPQEPS